MVAFAVVMVIVALVVTTAWYVPLILSRYAHPVPATFIIVVVAFWIASPAHLAVPGVSITEKLAANITLYVATVQSTLILALIMYTYVRNGEWRVAFDKMQKFCFLVMGASLVYWFLHKDQSQVTYWTVQGLMVLAYSATVVKIVSRKFAFDSIGQWATISAASIFGFIPAIEAGSVYGIGNSIRSLVCSGLTALLFYYYDCQHGGVRWNAEKQTLLGFYDKLFTRRVSWRQIH